MTQRRARWIGIGVLLIFLGAFLVDRVALYAWGLGVLHFRDALHQSIAAAFKPGTRSVSISEISRGEVMFMEAESGPTDIGFMKSSVRPDYIRKDAHGIELWYLPPALAWTTRFYPRCPDCRPIDHYQYLLVMHGTGKWGKPVVDLYWGRDRQPVPVTTTRPEVFP